MVSSRAMFMLLLQHLILASQTVFSNHFHYNPSHALLTDKGALLAFKRTIVSDPLSVTANWEEGADVCNFTGVTCNRKHHRVSILNLTESKLVGLLSPSISNLTGLRYLELVDNHFYGIIPPEFGYLRRLRYLKLDGNDLHGSIPNTFVLLHNLTELTLKENNLSGSLPPSLFSNCTSLENVDLSSNSLSGRIPPEIGNCPNVWNLNLYDNHFYGIIPPEFGYLRRLRCLKLDGNKLHGSIPNIFVLLHNLSVLMLKENNLSGSLPPSLFSNCTSLKNVDLSSNRLSGIIPPEIGNCPNVWNLNLYNNQFTGRLPFSISNATRMYNLDVENNHLSGEMPSDIVRNLPCLNFLHLSVNKMVSHDCNTNLDPFFSALANCTQLEELELFGMGLGGRLPNVIGKLSRLTGLQLQDNNIFGSIPPQIANLTNLFLLNLSSNLFNETIPTGISSLSRLDQLLISHNYFAGAIPDEFGNLSHLGLLDLSHNRYTGHIPESLGNLFRIYSMFLNNNMLSGSIPSKLGQCSQLYKLDLSHNNLTGRIPPELLLGIHDIGIFLNLSHNHLEGVLPIELSKLEKVQEIDLSWNKLSGDIFSQISSCIAVKILNFAQNSLQGPLPDSIGDLKDLEFLDISENQLSGRIPTSLNKITTLKFLNLSYNKLSGAIPQGGVFKSVTSVSFLGNQHLCGSVAGMQICSPRQDFFHSTVMLVIFCVVISISAMLSTAGCVIGFKYMKRITATSPTNETVRDASTTLEIVHNFPRITYKELSDATAGFDELRKIGTGSYGRVYKGVLSDGTAIAVKVLHLQTGNSTKSFNRECQVLKRIRHRNLIRIITACSLPDFKALVLPFMENGSLDYRLYPHSNKGLSSGSSDLSLLQRVSICSDIAEGMAYLHHHSPVKVIHCDLKPSNVLLNDDMTALVSDFGISRLVMTFGGANAAENLGNSTANMLHGSIGYIAPEYAYGSNTSTKGDVYSFGVLVLEMVTRKRPTDEMFAGGLNLNKWVKSYYHGRMEKLIDSSLMRATRDQSPEVKKMWEVALGELIELGILCTQESPSTRPTMLDCADDLDRLKRYLTGDTSATFASSLGISSSTWGGDD